MDWDRVVKFIKELRKEQGLTQEALASLLSMSRENVSKWERRVNNPTAETLVDLGKIFNVSVNELIAGERRTEENAEKVDNASVEIIKENSKNVKKIIIRFLIIIFSFLFIFLAYYFINTYNTIYVYRIAAENDNFVSMYGITLFSKSKSYMQLGLIEPKKDIEYDEYEVFYYDKNGKEKQLLEFNNTRGNNFILNTDNTFNEYFNYKKMQRIINNSYIRIKYQDKEDIIKLEFKRDMINNFLLFNKKKVKTEEKNSDNLSNQEIITKAEKYFEKNFKYDVGKDMYVDSGIRDKINYKVEYSKNNTVLTITEDRNKLINSIKFNFISGNVSISILNDDNVYDVYNVFRKQCLSTKCNNSEIENFLNNYYYKYIL